MRLARNATAPARLWRYLVVPPGGTCRERYDAMPPAEKERERWQSMRRNGLLAFVNLKAPKREP
jgi:hypothetical protein